MNHRITQGYLQCQQALVDFSTFHSCLSIGTGRVSPAFITCTTDTIREYFMCALKTDSLSTCNQNNKKQKQSRKLIIIKNDFFKPSLTVTWFPTTEILLVAKLHLGYSTSNQSIKVKVQVVTYSIPVLAYH